MFFHMRDVKGRKVVERLDLIEYGRTVTQSSKKS